MIVIMQAYSVEGMLATMALSIMHSSPPLAAHLRTKTCPTPPHGGHNNRRGQKWRGHHQRRRCFLTRGPLQDAMGAKHTHYGSKLQDLLLDSGKEVDAREGCLQLGNGACVWVRDCICSCSTDFEPLLILKRCSRTAASSQPMYVAGLHLDCCCLAAGAW